MKERYKCLVSIENEPMIFKRYGENEDEVRQELIDFITEKYEVTPNVLTVEKDKIHPYKKKEEITNA